MKKANVVYIISFCLCITLAFFGSCHNSTPLPDNNTTTPSKIQTPDYFKGVWISYTEFADMIKDKTVEQYKAKCAEVIEDIYNKGYNTVILHVRAHCDAYYFSDIFPFAKNIKKPDFDPLNLFLSAAKARSITVHGWINPYRGFEGMESYFKLESGAVVKWDGKEYLNPAKTSIQKLIIDGVKELLDKYDLQGIHIDDYFYPTSDKSFDAADYEAYKAKTKSPVSLADFRRGNINSAVLGIFRAVKSRNKVFGISPCADIDKNRDELYADVEKWMSGGFCDYICPQLYFGFQYPDDNFKFDKLVEKWQRIKSDGVKLYIGLGAYKKGTTDAGSDEWITNGDLIQKQIEYIKPNPKINGYCVYSYSYLNR